ncbi:MAG TPA: methyltransferase domain-containing protein [Acidimicrobiales bacterium]|jgi:ubiquinone/menaquinone biosynthesis C-methylase UbiE|nr:methyltransferase domain-containing protein [Acidimicrobiales bacterium]
MTVQGPTTEERRTHIHAMWASVADRWAEHAEDVDARGAVMTRRMLELTAPRPGDRVLELACGPGGAGLAAAERVGPAGEVVLSDVVASMAAIAADRATARGLTNVRAATLDLEQIDQPDASYDIVLCREGLMFAVNPDEAAREIHRVLRPAGRVAIAVWGPRDQNPWLSLVFDAVSAQIGSPVPPPGMPGPFSLDDPSRLGDLLTAAGLTDVVVEEIPTPLRAPSFEAWWARTSAIAGPLAGLLANLPEPARVAIAERLRAAVQPYTTSAGVELPGLALVASAHRP